MKLFIVLYCTKIKWMVKLLLYGPHSSLSVLIFLWKWTNDVADWLRRCQTLPHDSAIHHVEGHDQGHHAASWLYGGLPRGGRIAQVLHLDLGLATFRVGRNVWSLFLVVASLADESVVVDEVNGKAVRESWGLLFDVCELLVTRIKRVVLQDVCLGGGDGYTATDSRNSWQNRYLCK